MVIFTFHVDIDTIEVAWMSKKNVSSPMQKIVSDNASDKTVMDYTVEY